MASKLAIDGGVPVRAERLRGGFHGAAVIDERETEAVLNVLRKRRLFRFLSPGAEESEAAKVENWYRERLGSRYALAVNGGTAALIAAMFGVDVGPGDEVIIPAHTFVATAAAVIGAGGVPVLAEVDDSLNLDPADFEAKITPHTKAVIPVHMRGVPARMDEIMAVAHKHDLVVVEDVAQSNGGTYKGRPLGSLGDMGCFSFQQYKIITSGEGGLIVTDSELFYDRARMHHDAAARFWEGEGTKKYDFVLSGENYRLSELSAALVWAQCGRLEPLLAIFRGIKKRIVDGLKGVPGITLQDVPDPEGDCAITFGFFVPDAECAKRFSAALNAENIACGTMYDNTIPDRHIYKNWPFMMSGLAPDRRAPWKSPFYKGRIQGYSPDQCPQTLDYLGRAILMHIDQNYTPQDADLVVEGVRKVAAALF